MTKKIQITFRKCLHISVIFAISLVSLFSPSQYISAQNISYSSVPNDPLKARIYKLDNGLTVYMSVYKDAPRIQTYIAVKTGSKNDPSDATGLAHYLEHLLFKGTDKFGTKDFSKEKTELDKIESLYEVYRNTTDVVQRKAIYHQIDSISGVAAHFAIANEYDKMLAVIGAKGTNAYTDVEQTVYVNDIPSNQLEKWLTIEAERFQNPVLRIFHTELEAVYEEKNRSLDNDGNKVWEALYAGLFQKHTYGTQTTIGTIEHLKNPSIKKIKEYFNAYYVPNNMAICIAGDFDPDATIKMIQEKFRSLQNKPVPIKNFSKEDAIAKPIVMDVYGPDAATMVMAYRFNGVNSQDADMIEMVSKLLYNGTAGLIDLNLNQKQKVLAANSFSATMQDYSFHALSADPREGQKLEEVRDLLLSQMELLKKGEFPDWLLSAIINEMKLQQIKIYESNSGRANAFVSSFILGIDWKNYTSTIDRLSKITKQEVIDFVKKNYSNNYVIVYKHTGEDKNAQKVEKPAITPVELNRESQSHFLQSIVNKEAPEIKPVFVNYQEAIKQLKIKNNLPLYYTTNNENDLFNLSYILEMGTNHDKKIGIATDYLSYLGTSKYTPSQLQQEFYKLGCSFGVSCSDDQIHVSLSGLNNNFESAFSLLESLLTDAQPNKDALDNLIKDILKNRADAKLSKNAILWSAMYNYAHYGAKSPFTNILSESELKKLKPEELIAIIKSIPTYQHHISYYGPAQSENLIAALNKLHKVAAALKPIPTPVKFEEQKTNDSIVYIVNYDMQQAEIIMLSKGEQFNKNNLPNINLFNEYFGGNMSSIVFQEMRESKALAYSVHSSYQSPNKFDKSNYTTAYIGTQADKLPEAMAGMTNLLTDLPKSDVLFGSSKKAILQKIETERITKTAILSSYERLQQLGLNYDTRKDTYEKVPSMTFEDVKTFQEKYIKNNKYTIIILGDKNKLDMKTLAKYGKVKFLTLENVFGY